MPSANRDQPPENAAARSSRRQRRLLLVLALNAVIVVAQVVGGLAAHSLGLLSDAGHNLSDVAAVLLSLVAVRLARRKPSASRSFGWHRSTVLAAQANAGAILVVGVAIAWAAIQRLLHPEPVTGGIVVVVAVAGMAMNGVAALALREPGEDLNMRSALLHMAGDALASGGVAVAGTVILLTGGLFWLDPAVSLGIAALIGFEAIRLMAATADVLLESTPHGLETAAVVAAMTEVEGIERVHDFHAWTLSSDVRALSAHLLLSGHPSLDEAQARGNLVRTVLTRDFGIAHATFEFECDDCTPPREMGCAMEEAEHASGHGRTH